MSSTSRRSYGRLGKGTALLLLVLWAAISIFPIYWMFATAFQTSGGAVALPPQLIPDPATLRGFEKLFSTPNLVRWTFNSVFVAVVTTLIYVLISSMAGYALAKRDFPGRRLIFTMYVASVLVPGMLTVVTTYLVVVRLGWTNNYLALIVPELASPFGAFLMCQALRSFPRELMDAARVDGCGEWGVFRRVVVPVVAPAMAVLAIFHFSYMWNSFVWPLTVSTQDAMRTLPVGLANLQTVHSTDYTLLMAAACFTAIPMIVVFFAAQRFFLKGVTVGAVKG